MNDTQPHPPFSHRLSPLTQSPIPFPHHPPPSSPFPTVPPPQAMNLTRRDELVKRLRDADVATAMLLAPVGAAILSEIATSVNLMEAGRVKLAEEMTRFASPWTPALVQNATSALDTKRNHIIIAVVGGNEKVKIADDETCVEDYVIEGGLTVIEAAMGHMLRSQRVSPDDKDYAALLAVALGQVSAATLAIITYCIAAGHRRGRTDLAPPEQDSGAANDRKKPSVSLHVLSVHILSQDAKYPRITGNSPSPSLDKSGIEHTMTCCHLCPCSTPPHLDRSGIKHAVMYCHSCPCNTVLRDVRQFCTFLSPA